MGHYIIIIYFIFNQLFLQAHSMQNGIVNKNALHLYWELKFVQITVVFWYYLTSYQNLKKQYWELILSLNNFLRWPDLGAFLVQKYK